MQIVAFVRAPGRRTPSAFALACCLALGSFAHADPVAPPMDIQPDSFGNVALGASETTGTRRPLAPAASCLYEGFCGSGWGWQWSGVTVVNGTVTFRAWSNIAAFPAQCPLSFTFGFGDGTSETAAGSSTNASTYVTVTHRYAYAGSFTVSVTIGAPDGFTTCSMATIAISPCWKDGVLCYQGSAFSWYRSGTVGALDIAGPVSVNGTLFSSGSARIDYTYDSSGKLLTATFRPSGSLTVPGVSSSSVLFAQAPSFSVNWTTGDFQPLAGAPASYTYRPGGLGLLLSTTPLRVGTSSVTIDGIVLIGLPGAELARFAITMRLPKGSNPELLAYELLTGSLTPSVTFADLSLRYDPPPADLLVVKLGARFPFAGGVSFSAELKKAACGLNSADVSVGGAVPDVPVAAAGPIVLSVTGYRGALDHICDEENLLIFVGGELGVSVAGVPIPGEFFSIDDVGLAYQHPLNFELHEGTPKVFGYAIGDARGFLRGNTPPYGMTLTGTINVANVIVGRASLLNSLSRNWISGEITGNLHVPDFACGLLDTSCRAIRALARGSLGSLPHDVAAGQVHVDGSFNHQTRKWQASFIAESTIGSLSLVTLVQNVDGVTSLLVGTNMVDLFQVKRSEPLARGPLSVQRGVTLPASLPGAVFAATGKDAAPPSLTLRAPDGRTLTPASPGNARFYSSPLDQTALFEVPAPAAGEWTLTADGLPAADVALVALAPKTSPRATFTRVEKSGSSVLLSVGLDPPSPATAVRFFFGQTAGGTGEPIGEAQDGASGSASVTWDVSAVAAGRYYVHAEATTSGCLPSTATASAPVTIGSPSSIGAPRALAGTRSGTRASLTWTPATSAAPTSATPNAVAAHNVLYTDRPTVAGYPYTFCATRAGEATVEGLDAQADYRFTVVAVDASGAYGPESNEIVLAGSASTCRVECQASVPASAVTGAPVSFQGSATPTACDQPVTFTWTFGDGASAAGALVSHAFAAAGTYTWSLTARSGTVSCTRSGAITVSTTGGAAAIWVPASAHAPGAAGTSWRTDLEVHNPGSSPVAFTIELFRRGEANPSPEIRAFQLDGGLSVRYGDVLDSVFGFTGAAALRITPAAGRLLVTSRTYNETPAGTFGQFVPGLDESQQFEPGDEARVIQLRQDPGLETGFRTNAGVVNVGAVPIDLELVVYDARGVSRGRLDLSLSPHEFRQVDRVFEAAGAGALEDGYLIVQSGTPGGRFLAFATVVDNRTGDPICVVPERRISSESVRWIPAAAHAAGAGGAVWRTDLEIHNGGTSPVQVTMEMMPRGGANASPASRELTVAPGACTDLDDVLDGVFSFSGAAALRFVPRGGDIYLTSRTFNLQPTGTFGQFVPGLSETRAVTPGADGLLIQLGHDPSLSAAFRTNLGLVNTTEGTAAGEVRLHSAAGALLGTVPFALGPHEFVQEDRVFERVTSSAVADGYAVVRVTTGSVFAFATVIDNRTGDPIFLPASR